MKAQEKLVEALNGQVQAAQYIASIRAADRGNATQVEQNKDLINLVGRADSIAAMHHKMLEEDEKFDEQRMKMEGEVTHYFAEQWKEGIELRHEAAVRCISEAAKDAEAMQRVSHIQTASGASAYLISKQQEQVQIRALLLKEQSDLTAAHRREIAEQQSFISQMQVLAASTNDAEEKAKDLASEANAQTKLTAATRQYNEEMARNKAAIQASNMETAKLNSSWTSFFAHANQETKSLAATIRGELQSSMEQATNSFSQGIAKSLVEGKDFGKSMISVAREMSESMIESLIRWGVQDLVTKAGMKVTAASLAGANATASMAAAPFPVDLGAPAFGASMMGTAMAFDEGGVVGGTGGRDSVSARLTPGEGIIPKQLMEGLTNAARHGGGDNNPVIHIHHNPTYQVQALDSAGVERVLEKHGDAFAQHAANHIRKMNH